MKYTWNMTIKKIHMRWKLRYKWRNVRCSTKADFPVWLFQKKLEELPHKTKSQYENINECMQWLTLFVFLGHRRNGDSFFIGQLNSKQACDLKIKYIPETYTKLKSNLKICHSDLPEIFIEIVIIPPCWMGCFTIIVSFSFLLKR